MRKLILKMRPLILTPAIKKEIHELIEWAEKTKIPLDMNREIAEGKRPPIGDDRNYQIIIPMEYRCIFSIEEHPGGWMKHLSISIPYKSKYPHPEAVNAIAKEFGIKNFMDEYVYEEKEVEAINIIAKYEGPKWTEGMR